MTQFSHIFYIVYIFWCLFIVIQSNAFIISISIVSLDVSFADAFDKMTIYHKDHTISYIFIILTLCKDYFLTGFQNKHYV